MSEAALRARVLADPGLAARLAQLDELDALVAALRALEPALSEDALRDALALGRGARDAELPAHASGGWAPIAIDHERVRWAHLAGARLEGPFFEDDVRCALARPLHRLVRPWSSLAVLEQRAEPALPIAGLVLHASRCGSTLLARVLAADPSTRVASEPAAVDDARPFSPRIVAAAARALCAPSSPTERRAVLKLDAWHALDVPLFREAFPGVPMVFVTRDPLEILVSHARRRGRHVVPGTIDEARLPAAHDGEGPADLDAHAARVLIAIHEAVLAAHREAPILVVDHASLPGAIEARVLPWLGLDDAPLTAMRHAASADAKSPDRLYEDDREDKRAAASPRLRALADRVRPAYDALVSSA